jgi:hypothetical protein
MSTDRKRLRFWHCSVANIHFDDDIGLAGFYIPQYRILCALDQFIRAKDFEKEIVASVEEEFSEVGFVELHVEGALVIRDGAADQVIKDQVFIPCLGAESHDSTMGIAVIHMTGDTIGLVWHGNSSYKVSCETDKILILNLPISLYTPGYRVEPKAEDIVCISLFSRKKRRKFRGNAKKDVSRVVSAKAPLRFTAIGATKNNRLEATPRRLLKMSEPHRSDKEPRAS